MVKKVSLQSTPLDRRIFLGFVLIAFAVASCTRKTSSDAKASTQTRVVSLSPSTTETMFAIGAGSTLVGRSRFCDTPPEVKSLPAVGGYTDPNFEAIFALRPTLVIGARGPAGPRLDERLREHGVKTFFPETESVEQIEAMIVALGRETGRETEASKVAARTQARIEAIAKAVSAQVRPRVLLLFDVEPIVVAGPKSFPDDLLARAGGINVVTEGGAYPVLSLERVLALDPDVVLDTTPAGGHSASRVRKDSPGWSKLRAVREGRVLTVSDESALRPGPRIADAVTLFARLLHPSLAL